MNDSGFGERLPAWFRMSATYYMDDRITRASLSAEVYFVRLLALAHQLRSDGRLTASQLQYVGMKLRSYRQVTDELIALGLLTEDTATASVRIAAWSKWQGRGASGSTVVEGAAGQTPLDNDVPRAHARARTRARDTGKNRIEEVDTTPSGSVVSTSAAAPRAGGAAAQPPEKIKSGGSDPADEDPPDGVRLTKDEALAAIRTAIDKGKERPESSGRDVYLGRPEWRKRRDHELDPDAEKAKVAKLQQLLGEMFPPPPENGRINVDGPA